MLKVKENKDSDLLSDQFEGISEEAFEKAKELLDSFQEELDAHLKSDAKGIGERMMESGKDVEGQDLTGAFKFVEKHFNTQELQNILLIQLLTGVFKAKTQEFVYEFVINQED